MRTELETRYQPEKYESFTSQDAIDTANGIINLLYAPQASILDDIRYALKLKKRFYAALDIKPAEQASGPLAFEPWLERARYERIISDPQSDDQKRTYFINQFRQETALNMITHLKERHKTEQSTTTFLVVGDKLRSSLLANEDFETLLDRGLEYRRQVGSKETIREEQEVSTLKEEIQPVLTDSTTPVGTIIIQGSPPGTTQDTPYDKRFIDFWQLKQNESGERYVERTRFTTDLDYKGYRKGFAKLDPDYFKDEVTSGLPFATFVISRPVTLTPYNIESLETLYESYFGQEVQTAKDVLLKEALPQLMPLIDYFVEEICREKIDWLKVATSFNATLNMSDEFFDSRLRQKQTNFTYIAARKPVVEEQIAYYGRVPVKTKEGSCGPSSGFSSSLNIFANSVGQFGVNLGLERVFSVGIISKDPDFCKNCPVCGEEINCIVRAGQSCPKCKAVKRCG